MNAFKTNEVAELKNQIANQDQTIELLTKEAIEVSGMTKEEIAEQWKKRKNSK